MVTDIFPFFFPNLNDVGKPRALFEGFGFFDTGDQVFCFKPGDFYRSRRIVASS
jgi:hypothetical protein